MKCGEERPSCSACIRIKQTCSYVLQGDHDTERQSPSSSADFGVEHQENNLGGSKTSDTNEKVSRDDRITPAPVAPLQSNEHVSNAILSGVTSPVLDRRGPVRFESRPLDIPLVEDSTFAAQTPTEAWAVGSVSSAGNVEADTAGWFGLLFEDAVLGNSGLPLIDFESDGLDIFGNSIPQTPVRTPNELSTKHDVALLTAESRAETSNTSLLERVPRLGRDQLYEKQSWHSFDPIGLLPQEQFLFQHFVRNISRWVMVPAEGFDLLDC